MRVLRSRLLPLVGLMAIACAAAVGCGDGGGESSAAESTGLGSEPARLVKTMVRVSTSAKNAKDCKPVAKVNLRSASKVVCPPFDAKSRKATRSTEPTRAATYGPAAVVDYRSSGAPKGASIVLYRNQQNEWTIGRWGIVGGETIGTDDSDAREQSESVLDDYLAAVRDRGCRAFLKVAAAESSDPKVSCKREFAATASFGRLLKANPGAEPDYVGGNDFLGFYRVDIERPKPQSVTISTVAAPHGALTPRIVLDAMAGPRPAGG
jgi:hypothetical protein